MSDIDALESLLAACDYEPIASYAVIGDCRSAALVSRNGSIDWLCAPDFSSPSLFAALLDRQRGGRFLIRPRQARRTERRYLGRSAVLQTTFHAAGGRLRVTDFMPMPVEDESARHIFRLLECLDGMVAVDVLCQPRPGYGTLPVRLHRQGDSGWAFFAGGTVMALHGDAGQELAGHDDLVAGSFCLEAGQRRVYAFTCGSHPSAPDAGLGSAYESRERTVRWWEDWCSRCKYDGPHPDEITRSCLALKLLTCETSGAVMAAVTTSLPESMAADRNWDYRYCWLRDTSLLLQSFIELGFRSESEAFLGWLLEVGRKPRLQPLYDLHGKNVPGDRTLAHLEGYRGRGPVRIGNSASGQLQLDIYGELIQTAYRHVARGGRLQASESRLLAALGDAVRRLWRQPDHSIWETRSGPRHYTYSKLMCWVALDRLLALGRQVALPIDVAALSAERTAIRSAIDADGFNRKLGSYVGYFGGSDADASLLLMLRYGYVEPGDRRLSATYSHIMRQLSVDGLLYRYPPDRGYDGIAGPDNLFAVCSFWAVDYLARQGEVEEAQVLFERLLKMANDVGLYSEQFDVVSGEALGNFPQAFTHAGAVTAGLAIAQARRGGRGQSIST